MELTGEEMIAQPQQRVWDCLNDPEVLKACLSGCEEISKTGYNDYKVVLNASVGPVKARFTGKLLLSNLDPPNAYSLAFEGTGGAAGFAKGEANVRLTAVGEVTKLAYAANAKIGGKIAQVGSRLVDGVARRIATDFFARFNELVTTAGPVEAPGSQALSDTSVRADPSGAASPTPKAVSAAANSRWRMVLTCTVLAAVVVLALYFYLDR